MKKVITLALALMASASFNVATAAKKKKKEEAKPAQVQLVSSSDTLSYVAGMALTEGLLPYLKQSQNIDTASIADFIRGFEDMIAAKGDMKMKAYAAGMTIAGQLTEHMIPGMAGEFKDSPDSLVTDIVTRGFADALRKDTTLFTQNAAEELFKAKREADKKAKEEKLYGENRRAGEQFLADNAKKDSVVVLPSGLQYKVLVKGEGEIPKTTDKVMVNYEGRLIDGTVFDSSAKHGQGPASFRANQVIKGWTEALTMMPTGSKWQLFIPQELAYGERNAGQIKPFSALIFDVELVGIDDPKAKIEELKKTKNEKTAAKKTAGKK